jgi:hypothetical protein
VRNLFGGHPLKREVDETLKGYLNRLNELMLSADGLKSLISDQSRANQWCGAHPATKQEIDSAEARLGVAFPLSYRSFLGITNGWRSFGRTVDRMLRSDQVGRLEEISPETLNVILKYRESNVSDEEYARFNTSESRAVLRPKYYAKSLLIGTGIDGELLLLNPHLINSEGEWETLFFAHWLPGNTRFPSFVDFVEDTLQIERAL